MFGEDLDSGFARYVRRQVSTRGQDHDRWRGTPPAAGAGTGALLGHLGKQGIDKAFQEQVRDYLKPGTSALFMMIEHVTEDNAVAALQQHGGEVIKASLSEEDTKRLQEELEARLRSREACASRCRVSRARTAGISPVSDDSLPRCGCNDPWL
jgi:hypothetical protein